MLPSTCPSFSRQPEQEPSPGRHFRALFQVASTASGHSIMFDRLNTSPERASYQASCYPSCLTPGKATKLSAIPLSWGVFPSISQPSGSATDHKSTTIRHPLSSAIVLGDIWDPWLPSLPSSKAVTPSLHYCHTWFIVPVWHDRVRLPKLLTEPAMEPVTHILTVSAVLSILHVLVISTSDLAT